jgi:PAS domain S-box-containing protein
VPKCTESTAWIQCFEITPENCLKLAHPEDREFVKRNQAQALIKGEPTSFDHRILFASGLTRWVHIESKALTFDESGKPNILFGTVQDVTEHKIAGESV